MRYYKAYGYKASLIELWRMSKNNPITFAFALLLKVTRSKALEFEQPDFSGALEMAYEQIPSDIQAALAGVVGEARAAGFTLESVRSLESDRNLAYGLYFLGKSQDRFLALMAVTPKAAPHLRQVKSALFSFDAAGRRVITSYSRPEFDPDPQTFHALAHGTGVAGLDRVHDKVLATRSGTFVPITRQTLGDAVAKNEERSYQYLRSRGVYSERYEK